MYAKIVVFIWTSIYTVTNKGDNENSRDIGVKKNTYIIFLIIITSLKKFLKEISCTKTRKLCKTVKRNIHVFSDCHKKYKIEGSV